MKLYTLSCVHTDDARGAEGCLSEINLYRTYGEAKAALQRIIDHSDALAFQKEIDESPLNGDFEPGEGRDMATWEHEEGWGEGLHKYYIHEFEILV